MAPNLTQIAEEFEISDEERDARLGGDVSIALFIWVCVNKEDASVEGRRGQEAL